MKLDGKAQHDAAATGMSGSETTLRLRATLLLGRRGSRQTGLVDVKAVALSVRIIFQRGWRELFSRQDSGARAPGDGN